MTDPKPPRDPNQLAKSIIDTVTGRQPSPVDPAAVALGRKDGLKGELADASSLTQERRAEIAKKAAAARWKKQPYGSPPGRSA
jgi:hypothetical protein